MNLHELIKNYQNRWHLQFKPRGKNSNRHDFSVEPIELEYIDFGGDGNQSVRIFGHIALFTGITSDEAKARGWVVSENEYFILASLEFARRYPDHDFSQYWRTVFPLSNREILAISQGLAKIYLR